MGQWCRLYRVLEVLQELQAPRESPARMESREILVKTGKRAHKDLQDSQGLLETWVLKETRVTAERLSPDPEDPQAHLDLQDQDLDQPLWTWRALDLTWTHSGAPLVCPALLVLLVLLAPPAQALL